MRLTSPGGSTFRTGSMLDHFIVSTDMFAMDICLRKKIGKEHKLIYFEVYTNFPIIRENKVVKNWNSIKWGKFTEVAERNLDVRVGNYDTLE